MQTPTKLKISPTGQAILDYLESRAGSSFVGIIAANRSLTIKHLRLLERAGLVKCLVEPTTFKSNSDSVGIEGHALNCGKWELSDNSDS